MEFTFFDIQQTVQELQSIYTLIEKGDYRSLENFDFGLRRLVQSDFDPQELGRQMFREIPCKELIVTCDNWGIGYAFFHPMMNADVLTVTGPYVLDEDIKEEDFYKKMPTAIDREHIKSYFHNMPHFPQKKLFLAGIQCLANGSCQDVKYILREYPYLPCLEICRFKTGIERDLYKELGDNLIKLRYGLETKLLAAIAGKDKSRAMSIGQQLFRFFPASENAHDLRMLKNELIAFNMLMRKMMETRGVQLGYLNKIYRGIIAEAEQVSSREAGKHLWIQMVRCYYSCTDYTDLHQYKPAVMDAIEYINENLCETLSLKVVSGVIGVSANYLSEVFRRETGRTLTQYIAERRIARAEFLLVNTDDSITDIALQVGMLDVNYFARKFKSVNGVAPTVYRIDNRKNK